MDAATYISLLKNPAELLKQKDEDLKAVANKYPYMSGVHLLLAKKYKEQHPDQYEEYLHKAAVYASDRKRLYHFMNTDLLEVAAIAEPIEVKTTPIKEPAKVEEKVKEVKQEEVVEEKPKVTKKKPKPAVKKKKTAAKKANTVAEKPTTAKPTTDKKEQVEKVTSKPKEDKPEKHTFQQWLQLMRSDGSKPVVEEAVEQQETVDELTQQVDVASYEAQILKASQKLEELEDEVGDMQATDADKRKMEELAHKSTQLDDNIVTETLAKIYAIQGKKDKAIEAYQNLSLKYPEKSAYFAQLIEDLKNK